MLDPQWIPADEDSPDLTDEEIEGATPTTDSNDFVRAIEEAVRPLVRPNVNSALTGHELRRRNPHLYCRTRVAVDGEPDKVLLFQVDWLLQKS